MGLTNRLVNSSPFTVRLPYEKGIKITIPADGYVDLSMRQMEDFVPEKPGFEEVRKTLDYFGLFLLDNDRSFDQQALAALEASYRNKKRQRDEFIQRLRDNRIATGRAIDDGTLDAAIDQAGYGEKGLGGEINKLEARLKILKEAVAEEAAITTAQLDPKTTCFATKPPKKFASETQLRMFLEENPQYKAEHERFVKELEKSGTSA